MNWLDVVLALIVIASVAASFRKGFAREMIGLASVVLALLLGLWFYGAAGAYLAPYLSSRRMANFGGFLLVSFGVILLGGVVSLIVGKFLRVTGLSFFDHLLGAGFGALRGLLIAVALVAAVMAFAADDHPPSAVVHSRLAPYVAGASRVFAAVAPHEFKDGFQKSYAQARLAWQNALSRSEATEVERGKK
ncbi:MAG: CvpA family protein [Bryobacteraceae bacterium]